MIWSEVMIAGFLLGLAGSLHCIGMCGPLSLLIPTMGLSPGMRAMVLLLYQVGRIVTYTIIGVVFGYAGRGIYLSGYQQLFSIGIGVIVLVIAIATLLRQRKFKILFFSSLYMPIQKRISRMLKTASNPRGAFLLGMANGLLPCGMIYLALVTTLTFDGVITGGVFMAMFGLGTFPAMMLVASAGQLLGRRIRPILRNAIPFMMLVTGLLLIMRGMNLGIPLLSPGLPLMEGGEVVCHP